MGGSPRFAAELIESSARSLAEWTLAQQAEDTAQPAWDQREREALRADTELRLIELATALTFDAPELFVQHVCWCKVAYASRGTPIDELERNLQSMTDVLHDRLPETAFVIVAAYIAQAELALTEAPEELPNVISSDLPSAAAARRFLLALLEADRTDAHAIAVGALRDGMPLTDVLSGIVHPAQAELGRMWHMNEIGVSDEHIASGLVEWVLGQLEGEMPRRERNGRSVVATSVPGDAHALGVRMVCDCFEADGWTPYLLGASTPAPDIIETLVRRDASLLALSAGVSRHLRTAAGVIGVIRSHPQTADTPILVGGPPFARIPNLWKTMGADGTASDLAEVVRLGGQLVDARRA
ncbi:MAG: cobalamin-dependent protein [Planctomycetota bacterium]